MGVAGVTAETVGVAGVGCVVGAGEVLSGEAPVGSVSDGLGETGEGCIPSCDGGKK